MNVKFKIFGLIAILLAISISQCYANLDNKKVITINYKGTNTNVLEKTLWIRLKTGTNITDKTISGKLNSSVSLTPLLPINKLNIINKRNSLDNKTLNSDQAKVNEIENKLARTFIMEYQENISPEEYIRNIQQINSEIELAEPYYIYELQGTPNEPNDPLLDAQSTFNLMRVREAWAAGLVGSPSTTIAISDVGVDVKHEDLAGNIAYNSKEIPNNGIDDDNNGYIDDYAGYNFSYIEDNVPADDVYHSISHGTEVAGIASATTNNGLGIAGTGNQCRYFPLKISRLNSDKVVFGYQAIIYAAENGIPVINCSWGRTSATRQFSVIEQDIIKYAISKNVSIVAASGNISPTITQLDVFYPAYYDGVLGVGEVNAEDIITSGNTTLSLQTSIMATGIGNYTCWFSELENEYQTLGEGTSYASPIVAGFLGLIRTKYPELNAREAIEFARLCTDDIAYMNGGSDFFLPGRVNMLKAVEMAPFSKPSIRPVKVSYWDNQGDEIERFVDTAQEINMNISAYNYLGPTDNLKFKIAFWGNTGNIQIINSEVNVAEVLSRSSVNINGFKFRITGEQPNFAAFKVLIFKGDSVIDFFTIPIVTDNDLATFSNNVMRFSVSDYGRFGSSVNQELNFGAGFSPNESANLLYSSSGLVLSINAINGYSSMLGNYYKNSDFKPIKRFSGVNKNIGSFELDDINGQKVLITARYSFPNQDLPLVRADFEIENLSDTQLENTALGLVFDWDMPINVFENTTNYFPNAIPTDANKISTAAQIVSNYDESEFVGTLVFTDEIGAVAQSAGFKSIDLKSNQDLTTILNAGTTMQYVGKSDIITATGMKFSGSIAKNSKKKLSILIAYSKQRDVLASILKNNYSPAAVNDISDFENILIYPNPSSNYIEIKNSIDNYNIVIFNCLGESVLQTRINSNERIDIKNLPNGTYFVQIGKQLAQFVKQ